MKKLLSTFHFPLSTFHFPLVLLLLAITFGSSIQAQCLVEGNNIIYTPNPSNTVVNNGTEWVKLYLHVCERNTTIPTVSDQEIATLMSEVNADFSASGVQFFYCLDRRYDERFTSNDDAYLGELKECSDNKDGIDVFLMPKEYFVQSGFGVMSGGGYSFDSNGNIAVPAEDVILWGKTDKCRFPFFTENLRYWTIPHMLSHELGHCLGLFHTHETMFGAAPIDGSDGDATGDLIEDTAPALDLQHCVNFDPDFGYCQELPFTFGGTFDCAQIPTQVHQVHPNYYSPDLDNIMANSNFEKCAAYFTPIQGIQIRATVQSNPNAQKFRHKVYNSDVTITSNVTWPLPDFPPSGNVTIKGNLFIDPGASLTILAGQISFPEMNIAGIRPGGLLTVGNATLTADCETWQGVRVGGNSTLPQSTATHGKLQLNPNAVIEHAYYGATSTYGGIISTDQAIFRNNFSGVYLGTYAQKHTLTNFDRTLFTRDICDRFVDIPVFFPASRAHATLYNVTGNQFINFNGCTFNDEGDKNKKPVNVGISSSNSDLRVRNYTTSTIPVASFFDNLSTGISHNLRKVRGLEVTGAEFNKCNIGVYASTSGRAILKNNTFNLGTIEPIPNNLITVQMGAWVRNNIPTALLESNQFLTASTSKVITIGSLAQDLGTYSNFIRGNDYQNNTIGNLSNGNNGASTTGLLYQCNDNTGYQSYDFSVVEQSTIRELQVVGDPSSPNSLNAVGNTFSYSNGNNGDQSDFSNNGPGQIRYYYTTFPAQEPLDFLGINKLLVNTFACEVGKPDPENDRDLDLLKQDYYTQGTLYQNIESQYNQAVQMSNGVQIEQKKRELTFTRQIMDEAVGNIISYENSHANNPDSIRKWLSNYNRFAVDQHVAFHFYQYGKVASADSFLQVLPFRYNLSTAESADLSAMRQVIAILPVPGNALNETQVSQLEIIASGPQEYFSTDWARTELSQYGHYYKPDYILPEIGTEERSEKGQDLESNASINHLYPNPARTTLQVVIEHPEQTSSIQVFDSLGKLLGRYAVPVGTPIYVLDSSTWPSGMYVIQYEQSSMLQFRERVFVQH